MVWAWTPFVVLKDLVLAQFSRRDLHGSAVAVVLTTRLRCVNFFDGPFMN